ncbi:MAG: hypothetical protein R2873_34450 [Caldilineaceae bacterium]
MLLLLVRFFGIREATLPVNLILAIAAPGLVTYLWRVPRSAHRDAQHRLVVCLRRGATLLLIGIYACTGCSSRDPRVRLHGPHLR